MTPLTIALSGVALFLAVAAIAVVIRRAAFANALVYGLCTAAALISLVAALKHLLGGAPPETIALPLGIPWLGAHFRIDALSAFFLAVVDLGAVTASLFALGYGRHEEAPQRVLPFYPAFLAGMNLVVLADDAFTFLVSWEFMSLTSWALVMAHHRERDNVHAGYVYIVMASFGTLALLLAFGLLAGPDGRYAFAQMRAAHPTAGLAALVLILALIGAGSKAGLVPLHVWLPLAHPAAPSHVSALMSGVMTKVAVYGFVRIVFDLAGEPAWWWSMVVLALGGITAVMGVLYALMQHDLKRLLAYHTVENIGIIFIGLGLALAFKAHGMAFAAALALTAGVAPRLQSFGVQEPAVLRLRRGAHRDRRARHGASRRPHPSHAADRVRVPGRLRGDLGIAAAQRLRLRVADVPGDPAEPAIAVVGPEVPGAGGRRAAGAFRRACRRLLRQGVRRDVSRPRAHARPPSARRKPTGSRSPRCISLLRSASSPASCRVCSSMRWRRLSDSLVGARMPVQTGVQWLSIVPIAESRSSYNGLLVFLFMAISARSRPPRSTVSPPIGCGARRPGIAAIPIRVPQRNTPRRALPSRSAACSAQCCFARARVSRCRRPATCGPRASSSICAIWSGTGSTRPSPPPSASPPTGSTICSS